MFEAIVRETADSIPETLLVDARPVRHDTVLTGLDADDLEDGSQAFTESRAPILHRLGIGATDALEERRCLFTRGVPREPPPGTPPVRDSAAVVREECLERPPFAVLVVGRPQPLHNPDGATAVRVRVLRFSTYAYGFWDYTLRCDSRGGWVIVERRRHLNVMS